MADLSYLLEKIDTETPGDLAIAPGATEATLFFIMEYKYLYQFFYNILGYAKVETDPIVGPNRPVGLRREIPMSHPRYPWLYADSVECVGIVPDGKDDSTTLEYAQNIFSQGIQGEEVQYKTFRYCNRYKKYRIGIKFKTLNYFVLNDTQIDDARKSFNGIGIKEFNYWDFDPLDPLGNKLIQKSYWDGCEYLRFTELIVEPENELVVNESGKGYWKSISLGAIQPYLGAPKYDEAVQVSSAGVNYVNVTSNKIKLKWYRVPKEVAYNPQYILHAGKVNYYANYNEDPLINVFNYPFFNFQGGTLLFTGITTEPSNFGFPIEPFLGDTKSHMLTNNLISQYYDITFNFLELSIPTDNIVLPNLANFNPKGGKMYSNGWNFVPFPNRQWYYIENNNFANRENALPRYWSYPFQAFFDVGKVD